MTLRKIALHPGDFYFTQEKVIMHTLLGSCIAIVIWHPKYKFGGMCHFMLPKHSNAKSNLLNGRFAEDAFEMFRLAIAQHNTYTKDYEVSVFGGGIMNPRAFKEESSIGEINSLITEELLKKQNFNVKEQDLRGNKTRRLSFNTNTGAIITKYIKHVTAENVQGCNQ
tara:strand:- start:1686 stop:2186 length:501 start_codon:yes stop_codon:yes gene_type:complete